MPQAPLPPNEPDRLKAVASYAALNGSRDAWTDQLVASLAAMTSCPIALVTIVDAQQQWFKGCVGLDVSGTPREQAFCSYTILSDQPLIVEDAHKDQRFADNPLVTGEPGIRFYAGVPVIDEDGYALGSLCAIDTKPRTISPQMLAGMQSLAKLISLQVASARRHEAILSASLDAIITIDRHGVVMEYNQPAAYIFGYQQQEALGQPLSQLIIPPSLREAHEQGMRRYFQTGEGPVLGKRIEITAMRKSGEEFPVELAISPVQINSQPCFTAFIRDRTETQELDAALRITRFTMENARDIVLWVGKDAQFMYANAAARQELGYTEDQFLTMRVFDIDAVFPKDQWKNHWQQLQDKGSLLLNSVLKRADGSTFPVEVSCNYIEHEKEQFNCVIARDVSERQRAQHALQQSEERFRDIAAASGEFIWETDAKLRYTYVSSPMLSLLGRAEAEVIGEPVGTYMPQEHAQRLQAVMQKAAHTKTPFRNVEHIVERADGQQRWQRLSGKALYDDNNQLLGFRGMGLDVTEFKLAGLQQRRLAELQSIARSVVSMFLHPEQTGDAVMRLLSEVCQFFHADCAYVFMLSEPQNQPAQHVSCDFGFSPEHKPQPDFAARASKINPTWVSTLHPSELVRFNGSLRAQGANLRLGQITGARAHVGLPIVIESAVKGYIGFDIDGPLPKQSPAEREILLSMAMGMSHAYERALQQSRLVESASQLELALSRSNQASEAKTSFLAHMSHELRTPITAVLGYTRMLLSGDLPAPQAEELLSKIDSNGRSLLNIINAILDLSKIEADSITLVDETVQLQSLFQAVINTVTAAAAEKSVDLAVHIGAHVPQSMNCDQLRITQVLTNLMANAVKYTDEGAVTLHCSAQPNSDNPSISFQITDTGTGITPEEQKHIFEAFGQGAAGQERGGSGLGLAITSRLIKMFGGSIHLQSTPNKGSTFTVTLPLASPSKQHMPQGQLHFTQDHQQQPSPDENKATLSGVHILLVEDSDHVREVVAYFLRERGANVSYAINGKEAVEQLQQTNNIDLVLMDMQMPIMDGYQATERLRSIGNAVPIIALTAHGMKHDREKCINAGCDDYLSKPIDPDMLAAVCLKYVTQTPPQSAATQTTDANAGNQTQVDNMQSLKRRYIAHLSDELHVLQTWRPEDDTAPLRRRVHKLAGSAGNLGFPQVTQAAQHCERRIRTASEPREITPALQELCSAIREGLNNHNP